MNLPSSLTSRLHSTVISSARELSCLVVSATLNSSLDSFLSNVLCRRGTLSGWKWSRSAPGFLVAINHAYALLSTLPLATSTALNNLYSQFGISGREGKWWGTSIRCASLMVLFEWRPFERVDPLLDVELLELSEPSGSSPSSSFFFLFFLLLCFRLSFLSGGGPPGGGASSPSSGPSSPGPPGGLEPRPFPPDPLSPGGGGGGDPDPPGPPLPGSFR